MKRLIYILLIVFTATLNCSDLHGMPRRIQFSAGHTTEYVYDADGRKLRTVHRTAVPNMSVPLNSTVELDATNTLGKDSTDYVGSFILRQGQLDKYLFDGGYVTFSGATPQFHYYGKDHLGNNRTVVNENGTLEQVTHYYPFGGIMGDITYNASTQEYKYNGKEFDHTHGLDWYDYGARNYDAVLGQWSSFDGKAEDYQYISPYAYALNNPVKNIDPDGKSVWTKVAKGFVKVSRSVAKNGVSALSKADTYLNAFSDVTDAINTLTDANASTGEKVAAGASLASELLPVSVGDVKDAGKAVKRISTAVHGNSKTSTKAQHAYDIINAETKKVVKTGVSGGRIRKDGKSSRAESQVGKWNKKEGEGTYRSEITHQEPAGEGSRERILEYEKSRAKELRERGELDPNKHQKP